MDEIKGLAGLAPRRKAAGYTQAGLAVALRVSRPLLSAWEAGSQWPSAGRLPEMARLLHCTIGELFEPPDTILPESEEVSPCSASAAISTKTPDALQA